MLHQYNSKNINYTSSGKGNTIVLIHGFTESLDIWNSFTEELSQSYHVICIDLPGHGQSDCIADIHTMETMSDVVNSVLENLLIKSCAMIGHSMGGYVVLTFADKYPEKLKGFGLFHSSAAADTEEGKVNRTRAIEIIKQNHHSYLTSFIPDLFASENKEKYAVEIEKLITTANKMTTAGVVAAQEGMKIRPNMYHILETANVPVLFIAGKKDSRIPFEKVMEQITLPEEAHVLLLKNVAHMGYIEAKKETLLFVKSFLKRVFNLTNVRQ